MIARGDVAPGTTAGREAIPTHRPAKKITPTEHPSG